MNDIMIKMTQSYDYRQYSDYSIDKIIKEKKSILVDFCWLFLS